MRIRRSLVLVAVVGLSLISVTAGFRFYHTLFNLTTAVLCCVIFETLRLGCLWSLVTNMWLTRLVAVPVYAMTSIVCAFVAITSFHADIIANHSAATKPVEEEIERRIGIVKRAYASKSEEEVKKLDERIDQCKRNLALYPEAHFWRNRLAQLDQDRRLITASRDSFLSVIPQHGIDEWISSQAARMGLTFEPLPSPAQRTKAFTLAIQELCGITELAAKKAISIIIVVTTELGIVMLSLLAQAQVSTKGAGSAWFLDGLKKQFGDEEIRSFVAKCTESLAKHGRMPYTRELGKQLREIRKYVKSNGGTEQEVIQSIQDTQQST